MYSMPRSPLPHPILYSTRTGKVDQLLFFFGSEGGSMFRHQTIMLVLGSLFIPLQHVQYAMPRSPLPPQSCTVLELGRQINSYSLLGGRGALFSTPNNDVGSGESFHPTSTCTSYQQGVHYLIQSGTALELRRQINSSFLLGGRGLYFPPTKNYAGFREFFHPTSTCISQLDISHNCRWILL
jgi:hypothetical protein